jgi:hypothetical protein
MRTVPTRLDDVPGQPSSRASTALRKPAHQHAFDARQRQYLQASASGA